MKFFYNFKAKNVKRPIAENSEKNRMNKIDLESAFEKICSLGLFI